MWFFNWLSCKVRGHKLFHGMFNRNEIQFCERCGKTIPKTGPGIDADMAKLEMVKAKVRPG